MAWCSLNFASRSIDLCSTKRTLRSLSFGYLSTSTPATTWIARGLGGELGEFVSFLHGHALTAAIRTVVAQPCDIAVAFWGNDACERLALPVDLSLHDACEKLEA